MAKAALNAERLIDFSSRNKRRPRFDLVIDMVGTVRRLALDGLIEVTERRAGSLRSR